MFPEKRIVWEKWIDPLNKNVDEVEYPGYNFPSYEEDKPVEFLSTDESFEEKMDEIDYSESAGETQKNITYNPIRIVSTSQGFVTLTEHSFASKHFDFWTMHYNHDITEGLAEAVESCPGVETASVLTRYRMRIGFNRPLIKSGAFNLREIKKSIEKTVIQHRQNDDSKNLQERLLNFEEGVKKKILEDKNRISQNKYWAIYVLPNGTSESISNQELTEDFKEKLSMFVDAQKMFGGEVLTSLD